MDTNFPLSEQEILAILTKYTSPSKLEHLEKVTNYCNILFSILKTKYNFENSDVEALRYSSLFHDLGNFINTTNNNMHSKYIVINDSLFDKLSEGTRNLVGVIAGSHNGKLDAEICTYPEKEQVKILRLIALLRLANSLDYSCKEIIESAYTADNCLFLNLNEIPQDHQLEKLKKTSDFFEEQFEMQLYMSFQ